MTYNDPHSPYEEPPPNDQGGSWAVIAVLAVIAAGIGAYVYNHRPDQTASSPSTEQTTTGSGGQSGDSRMAPPPPAPVK